MFLVFTTVLIIHNYSQSMDGLFSFLSISPKFLESSIATLEMVTQTSVMVIFNKRQGQGQNVLNERLVT